MNDLVENSEYMNLLKNIEQIINDYSGYVYTIISSISSCVNFSFNNCYEDPNQRCGRDEGAPN